MEDWKQLYKENKIINGLNGFRGKYAPLSNFYKLDIPIEIKLPKGKDDAKYYKFNTVENAFQASKCLNHEEIKLFTISTPGQAKMIGKRVILRTDWDKIKNGIMLSLLMMKFSCSRKFQELLISIPKDKYIVEMNQWGDTYWGVDRRTFKGQNNLGKLLMQVISELEVK